MPYKVKITPVALTDLQKAINYYNDQKPGLGKRFNAAVQEQFLKMEQRPMAGSFMYDSVRFKVVKKFPYIILYEMLDNDVVAVYRIFNTNRQPYWM